MFLGIPITALATAAVSHIVLAHRAEASESAGLSRIVGGFPIPGYWPSTFYWNQAASSLNVLAFFYGLACLCSIRLARTGSFAAWGQSPNTNLQSFKSVQRSWAIVGVVFCCTLAGLNRYAWSNDVRSTEVQNATLGREDRLTQKYWMYQDEEGKRAVCRFIYSDDIRLLNCQITTRKGENLSGRFILNDKTLFISILQPTSVPTMTFLLSDDEQTLTEQGNASGVMGLVYRKSAQSAR